MTDIGELVLRIKADAAQLEREIKKANGIVKQSAGEMEVSVGSLRRQFVALTAAIGGAQIIRSIMSYEKLQASLKTVTGSAEAAAKAFSMVQGFAETTPFGLEEATAAFIKLKALGLTPSEEALRSYGNTASAMGKSLNQMIEAVADATTGEFERLKEFGIKTRQEGNSVTFTFQGVATKVGKSAAEIEDYLRKIGDVNFAGAMKEQENTVSTSLSNMGDSFGKLAKAIGDAGLSSIIIAIADTIRSMNEQMAESIRLMTQISQTGTANNTASAVDLQDNWPSSPSRMRFGQTPSMRVSDTPFGPDYVAPKPTAIDEKAIERMKKAREALSDYNRALEEERVLLGLTERDQAAQEARFRVEEIARKGGIKLTEEQIQATEAMARANYDLKKSQDDINKATQEAARFQQELHDRLSRTLTDTVFRANNARDAMLGFAESIARAAFEKKVAGPLADALIGTGGSKGLLDNAIGNIGSIFGGFFADGGSPPVGVPSIVGERGPEIFVPNTAGTIVPNHQLGGRSVVVNQTFALNPGATEQTVAQLRSLVPSIMAQTKAEVFAALEKGGTESQIARLRS